MTIIVTIREMFCGEAGKDYTSTKWEYIKDLKPISICLTAMLNFLANGTESRYSAFHFNFTKRCESECLYKDTLLLPTGAAIMNF
jgi:hypothetical protein